MSCERRPLTEADREEISRGVAGGLEGTVIAARIGWSAGVVSREITRHGGRAQYRAVVAQGAAAEQRRRPTGPQAGCLPAAAG
ncbi:MAG: hypothetical protein ACRDQ9_19390 [Pseudonocardiaceae bacterium]